MDGTSSRQRSDEALTSAVAFTRALLQSSSSRAWRQVTLPNPPSSSAAGPLATLSLKGKGRETPLRPLDPTQVVVHRRSNGKGGEVYRAVSDVEVLENETPLDAREFVAVLGTPELKAVWNRMVESAITLDVLDPQTHIAKTEYRLGWPASPRDAITISRTFSDATTVLDISTSLPRHPDEPAYLRPAPPYVRSHVSLFAWCIQLPSSSATTASTAPAAPTALSSSSPSSKSSHSKLRITYFWQWDLKGWASSSTALSSHIPTLFSDLVAFVRASADRVPTLSGFGTGITLAAHTFDPVRDRLTVDYAVVEEDEGDPSSPPKGLEDIQAKKERRRLERSLEFALPASQGWDVQVSVRSQTPSEAPGYVVVAEHERLAIPIARTNFRITHSRLANPHDTVRVRLSIELSGGAQSTIRLNGAPQPVREAEPRDPTSLGRRMLEDSATVSGISLHTAETGSSTLAHSSASKRMSGLCSLERSPGQASEIASMIRRNYIYFSSLLQEPEAKWKHVIESRGVSISQLDSIDPTLVVYRAEATFVGINVWDLFSVVSTPSARAQWDRGFDEATLLEDVNSLTSVWHVKNKPAWPVSARDTVLVTTSYKAPASIHSFSFSTDDTRLFPTIPSTDQTTIRTQVDLLGFAIESLSPTTTQITLLEQSDPKGWSNKSSIPQLMINLLAGIGEFAIKTGGPPVVTRLHGARAVISRYDYERNTYRLEYQARDPTDPLVVVHPSDSGRRTPSPSSPHLNAAASRPTIECELRCDTDTWANSLDIVIDPPPATVSCLRRHRLSAGGGGVWITAEHDPDVVGDSRIVVLVRKGSSSKERGTVIINGSKIRVDVEDMNEADVKALTKMKRARPARAPLDCLPAFNASARAGGVVGWKALMAEAQPTPSSRPRTPGSSNAAASSDASATGFAAGLAQHTLPFARMISPNGNATGHSRTASSSLAPAPPDRPSSSSETATPPPKPPMRRALDALSWVRRLHDEKPSPLPANSATSGPNDWVLVSDKDDLLVHRRTVYALSNTVPVHRGERVLQGVSAEEIVSVLSTPGCRREWDDRFAGWTPLESYGAGCSSAFLSLHTSFPFRDRGFYLASITARSTAQSALTSSGGGHDPPPLFYHASASFSPERTALPFNQALINPQGLPVGRIVLDGWVCEELDPYGDENFPIPSTRVTRFVAFDLAGSAPAAINNLVNASMARAVVAIGELLKQKGPVPTPHYPTPFVLVEGEVPEEISLREGEVGWVVESYDEAHTLVGRSKASPREFLMRTTVALEERPTRRGRFKAKSLPSATDAGENEASTSNNQEKDHAVEPTPPSLTLAPPLLPPSPPAAPPPSGSQLAKSRSSFSSGTSTSRGSGSTIVSRTKDLRRNPANEDLLVAELVVDLQQYPAGYEVLARSRWPSSASTSSEAAPSSSSISSSVLNLDPPITSSALLLLPFQLSIRDVSRPATSLEKRKQLVRLTLPTSTFAASIDDPLRDTSDTPPPSAKPEWMKRLEEGAMVVVDVTVKGNEDPVAGADGADGKVPAAARTYLFNGDKVSPATEKLTARELEEEPKAPRFSCIPLSPVLPATSQPVDRSLPELLLEPLAVAEQLLKQPEPEPEAAPTTKAEANDKRAVGDPAGENQGVVDRAQAQPLPGPGSTPAGISFFSFLSYPALACLSSSDLFNFTTPSHPFTPATDGAADASTLPSAIDKAVDAAAETTADGDGDGAAAAGNGAAPAGGDKTGDTSAASAAGTTNALDSVAAATFAMRRSPTLRALLLLTALIAFLLGSLLRSLLSPADFVVYVTPQEAVERGLNQEEYREIQRMVEIKWLWAGWDLVFAAARRP